MYNRYIPNSINYTPVEPAPNSKPSQSAKPMGETTRGSGKTPSPFATAPLLSWLNSGGSGRLSGLFKGSKEQSGLLRSIKEKLGEIDRGDILLLLIVLLIATEEEEWDLVLALGAVLLFGGEEHKENAES